MPYPAIHTKQFTAITPSTNGATKLSFYGIIVGGTNATTKSVNLIDGTGVTTLVTVPTGTIIYGRISGVRSTNTTASAVLVGLGPT